MKLIKEEFEVRNWLKEFINRNSDLINSNNFDALYKIARQNFVGSYVGTLTRLFLESGINPLKYMNKVPDSFLSWDREVQAFSVPSGIEFIEESAFYGCENLTHIHLPEGLKSIGTIAFGDCSSLTSIDIPKSVASIGFGAFTDSGLTKILIPENVSNMKFNAFERCKNLKEVLIDSEPICNNLINLPSIYAYAKLVGLKYRVPDLPGFTYQGIQGNGYYLYIKEE